MGSILSGELGSFSNQMTTLSCNRFFMSFDTKGSGVTRTSMVRKKWEWWRHEKDRSQRLKESPTSARQLLGKDGVRNIGSRHTPPMNEVIPAKVEAARTA